MDNPFKKRRTELITDRRTLLPGQKLVANFPLSWPERVRFKRHRPNSSLKSRYRSGGLADVPACSELALIEVNNFHFGLLANELAGVHEGAVPPASQVNSKRRDYSGRSFSS